MLLEAASDVTEVVQATGPGSGLAGEAGISFRSSSSKSRSFSRGIHRGARMAAS